MNTQLDPSIWRVSQTVDYICQRDFKIVTLQFPDDLLPQSAQITQLVQVECASRGHPIKAYILADTTYNPLSVDEVAAAHVDAQCIIHYGRASLTDLSRVPAYFVFPHHPLPPHINNTIIDTIIESLERETLKVVVVVFIDQIHADAVSDIKACFQSMMDRGIQPCNLIIADSVGNELDPGLCGNSDTASFPCSQHSPLEATHHNSSSKKLVAGYTWPESDDINNNSTKIKYVWIGSIEAPALYELQLTYNTADWLVYDTLNGRFLGEDSSSPSLLDNVTKTLRRRYFLVEKARNATIIGIVMGTLGVAGYRQVLTVLKQAAAKAGKKSYTFLMGKPSPAKLANFPEVEVFVLVADPQGQILDCKEYLAPIITPHEAMIAFSGKEWDASSYRLDFQDLLSAQAGEDDTYDDDNDDNDGSGTALAVHAQRALQVTKGGDGMKIVPTSAAEYMVHKRTWKGVDAPVLTGAEEKESTGAVEGRTGRARGYEDEREVGREEV